MRRKLTTKSLDALPPADGKRYEVRDELLTGLHLRVSASGGKVWYLATRVDGRLRRIKLGTYPVLSLSDAREKARSILRDIQLGVFQQRDAEPLPERRTLGDIIPDFVERYAKRYTKDWRGTQSVLLRMSGLHRKVIGEIKRADVVRELEAMVADIEDNGGKGTRANRGLAALKKLFSWCIDQGIIEHTPIAGLKPLIREVARERCLTDQELQALWVGAQTEAYPFREFVMVLMFTGQRLREISDMRWSEVDLDRATLTLKNSRTKNGNAHILPLTPAVVNILRGMPRFLGSDFVFTTTGTTPISGFGRLKKRLETFIGLDAENWRFHDLRRTMATNVAMLRVQPHIIEAVLNHQTGIVSGVAAVYNRHAYLDEKREAMAKWAERLEMIVTKTALDVAGVQVFA